MTFTTKSNKQLINELQENVNNITIPNEISDINSLQAELNSKQNLLTAGDNITITDGIISSSGGGSTASEISDINGLQGTLNSKQNNLNSSSNITVNRLDMGSTYGFYLTDQSIIGTKIFLDTNRLYYKNTSGTWSMMLTTLTSLQSQIYNKEDKITSNSLAISDTSGLQTALDGKQDIITSNSLTISNTSGLQSALDGKQNIINDNSLSISNTSGLQSALDGKAAAFTLTGGNNISINENNLSQNGNVITISADLSSKQDVLTAGDNITIQNGVISVNSGSAVGGGSTSSNQLSRTSYYHGWLYTIPNGITDYYHNNISVVHNNLNIPFTAQTSTSNTGWFLESGTYKIEYKCNFDNGGLGNRLGIQTSFMFNDVVYGPSTCYGYSRANAYIDRQTVDSAFIYTVPANGEYMRIKNNCALNTNTYNDVWANNAQAGPLVLIITRIDQIDVVTPTNLSFDAPLSKINDVVSIDLSNKQDVLTAGDNITINNGVISSIGGGSTYEAGSNITITEDNYILIDPNPVFASTVTASKTKIGSYSDRASLSHIDFTSYRDMAFQQLLNGTTLLNSKLGTDIRFCNNGDTMAKFSNNDFYITRNNSLQNLNTVLNDKQDKISSSTNIVVASLVVSPSLVSISVGPGDIVSTGKITASSLSIAPDTDMAAEIGRVKIGYVGHGNHAGFAHRNHMSQGGYALLQSSDGTTILNSANGRNIHFRANNNDKMLITHTGRVGIGTTNPAVALDVHPGIDYYTWGTYFNADNNWHTGQEIKGATRQWQTRSVSIMGQGILSWGGFFSASDSRFKKNIQDINDSSALDLLRKIEPKKYEYIDKNEKGGDTVYGFIAQQIAEVFPHAANEQREKIPNIYERGFKVDNVITLQEKSTNLLEKDAEGVIFPTLLVFHPDGRKIEFTIKTIIDDKRIEIEPSEELDTDCELFIYGNIVDNFNVIDKNYIFTIATAALQEVDRQLQAEKVKNVDILSRIEAIESKQNDTIISTYTRDNYLFKFIMPIGKIKIKKAIFEHSDITGAYKLKKIDGSLLGIFNGLNVIESHEFDSNGIVKFMLYDMNDNILACDNGVVDTLVIV